MLVLPILYHSCIRLSCSRTLHAHCKTHPLCSLHTLCFHMILHSILFCINIHLLMCIVHCSCTRLCIACSCSFPPSIHCLCSCMCRYYKYPCYYNYQYTISHRIGFLSILHHIYDCHSRIFCL